MPGHKAATVLLSLFLATSALGADDADMDADISPLEYCKDFSIIAREVMTARQMDVPMSETLPAAQERLRSLMDKYGLELDLEGVQTVEEASTSLVILAYEKPSYLSESSQRDAISDFENVFFALCYKTRTSILKE